MMTRISKENLKKRGLKMPVFKTHETLKSFLFGSGVP